MNNKQQIADVGQERAWTVSVAARTVGLYIIHCSLIFVLTGCLTTKQQVNEAPLLRSQSVRGNRSLTVEQLESLLPQKPNSRILGLPITPRLWFYRLGEQKFDRPAAVRALQAKITEFDQQSQQIANQPVALRKLNRRFARQAKHLRQKAELGNWLMRNLGEPPVYFHERDVQSNSVKIQKYLVNKGFFHANVAYMLDTLRQRQVRVTYVVDENAGFFLRNLTYEIDDPLIDSIVRRSLGLSKLVVGSRYDGDNIAAEKVRIESLLRDRGYYGFSRQFIPPPEVDTLRRFPGDTLRRSIDMYVKILNPPGQAAHPVYHIGEVEVRINPDEKQIANSAGLVSTPDTILRNGVFYQIGRTVGAGRQIPPQLLDTKIRLRPGQLYNQTYYRDTQRQLFLLNQFKFVNLNFTDTTNRQLRTLITATPLDKFDYTLEGGVTVLYSAQTKPGGFVGLTLRARNLLGGLETFEMTGRYGLEYQTGFVTNETSGLTAYQSQELNLTSSITFPQILFPSRARFLFNPYNPRTQVSLGYTNTLRPDFRRSLLRATMAYNWQITTTKQFSFLIADINLINTKFDTELGGAFQAQLEQQRLLGSTVYLSFRRSLSSSFSFAYTYNTNIPGQNRRANFLRTILESGGTTLNFFSNKTLQHWSDSSVTGLQFYKFLRLNVDYRHYIPIRSHTTLAFRVNAGLVYGYGPDNAVPYEKFFFAGGSNSLRAWPSRRLGPGAELPQSQPGNNREPVFNNRSDRNQQFAYTFEKPGDMLIEGSAELRGRLFHLLADINGALFVDAGNVWTIRNNPNRYGEDFRLDTFIPQIAVGTGVGLRIDFSFFIIRLDGGIKVWDPARRYISTGLDGPSLVDDRFLLPKFSLRQLSSGPNPLIVNFGIGYPF